MLYIKAVTVPVIEGTPCTIKKGTDKHINKIPGSPIVYEIQNFALCSTAYLFRREQ